MKMMKILLMKVLMRNKKITFNKKKIKMIKMKVFSPKFLISSIINQLMTTNKQGSEKKDILELQKEIKVSFFTKNIAFKKLLKVIR